MLLGSVAVASSQTRTSPARAVPSCRDSSTSSVAAQNAADIGLPAASSRRRSSGSEDIASSGGTDSRPSATSRRVRLPTGRPAS